MQTISACLKIMKVFHTCTVSFYYFFIYIYIYNDFYHENLSKNNVINKIVLSILTKINNLAILYLLNVCVCPDKPYVVGTR